MKKFKRLAALFLALMLLAACSGGGDTTTPPDDVQDPDTQGSQEQDDTQGGEEVTTLKVGLYGDRSSRRFTAACSALPQTARCKTKSARTIPPAKTA